MRGGIVFTLLLAFSFVLVPCQRSTAKVEENPLVAPLKTGADLIGGGMGQMIKDMIQTLETFSQVTQFLGDDSNIRHLRFLIFAFMESLQEASSEWKDMQSPVNGEGLGLYLEGIKNRMSQRLKDDPDFPGSMVSFFNHNMGPVFDSGSILAREIDFESLPFRPTYDQLTRVIGFVGSFKLAEMFNPEVFRQAFGMIGNPFDVVTKMLETNFQLSSEQIKMFSTMVTMFLKNQKTQGQSHSDL